MSQVPGKIGRYTPTPWSSLRLYRPFVRASLAVALTLGFTTGAVMLVVLALGLPWGVGWVTHGQAHGMAQLFGWAGLFAMGIAYHVVPRFRNAPIAYPWPQYLTLALGLAAIALRFVGQTLYSLPTSPAMLVASGVALLAATGLFAVVIGQTLSRGSVPRGLTEQWLWAGTLWAVAAAGVHMAMVAKVAFSRGVAVPANWDNAFIHASLLGFLGNYILGVSLRAVSAFMALRPVRQSLARVAFWAFNLGAACQVTAWLLEVPAAWLVPGAAVELAGVMAFVAALRVLEPRDRPREYMPGTYVRYEWFLRASYVWLLVGSGLMALQTVNAAWDLSLLPALTAAPALHVLALGFVSMMIMGMAARMLPLFEGAQLPHHRLMDGAFLALNSSVALRLAFGLVPGRAGTFGLGVSGVLGLLALVLFAWVVWRVLRPAAQEAYRKTAVEFVAVRLRQQHQSQEE